MHVLVVFPKEFIRNDVFGNFAFVRVDDSIAVKIEALRQAVVLLADVSIAVLPQHNTREERKQ